MAPNAKVAAAYRAMESLGIEEWRVKPVLKNLLKLYDKNWELIEEENYRALADAIFEDAENNVPELKKVPEKKKKSKKVQEEEMEDEEAQMDVEPSRPLKRLRLRGQESQPSNPSTSSALSSASSPSKEPLLEDDTLPKSCSRLQPQNTAPSHGGNARIEVHPGPVQDVIVGKGKQPVSPQVASREKTIISRSGRASPSSKEPTVKSGMLLLPSNKMPQNHALTIPKDEPGDELPDSQLPIAVIPPEASKKNSATVKQNGHDFMASSKCRDGVRDEDIFLSSNEGATSNVEIASSTEGDVKISLSCSSAVGRLDFCMPTRDQLLQMTEEKCLQLYKITDPNFSIPKLLKDICDCVLEFSKDSNSGSREGQIVTSGVDVLKESEAHHTVTDQGNTDLDILSLPSDGSIIVASLSPQSPFSLGHQGGQVDGALISAINDLSETVDRNELEGPMSPNSHSLVVVPQHLLTADDIRSFHDVKDLTKGEESVQISWGNTISNDFPPSFHYIPQNLVFQDAYVNISLSRIVDNKDCCSSCIGNCALLPTPCACANKTGGEFAYNAIGLLKEKFLDKCIAISRNPKHHYFYCKECPLERSKNDGCLEPCKGHLKRKFIKECWSKCSCGKQCGNRIVQRGITCNLQVFFTSEGKGWGLRTLEDLPRGAFVCEFVGEILTIKELHERNMKSADNGKDTYPVLLDADWDSGFVKDEEALCLDAASFGNVARFINHRCYDANLIEIPVEVECPDHHYYHFALFTCRKVAAQEELTWDYGIQFDDRDHPVKVFQCKCGSKFCRNMKRSNRSLKFSSNAR